MSNAHHGQGEISGKALAGHLDQDKTTSTITSRYYFPQITKRVAEMIRYCCQCQQINTGGKLLKSDAELHLVQIPSTAWLQIMDLIRTMNKFIEGKTYIVTAVDYTMKYVEAEPISQKNRRRSS